MKTLIIGLDAFDPVFFEKLAEAGKLPHLSSLASKGAYSRLEVADPPQSEVSWTSIATGMNPGEHAMFDFVHRDPENYDLQVSLLPMGRGLGGLEFIRPYQTQTIFDLAADLGYPSTSLWWPATFPARPESPVRTIPGLGTPDIQGRLGVGSLHTTDPDMGDRLGKTPVYPLKLQAKDKYSGELLGPQINRTTDRLNAVLPFEIQVSDSSNVELRIGKQVSKLEIGKWSPILELRFKVSWLASAHAITRLIVTSIQPELQVYFLPLQIHPLHPIWRYGTPGAFIRDSWQSSGPFLTLGWPQDTTGLEDGCINDEQFLRLCDSIYFAREKLLFHSLDQFQEGLLASVFDSLDRIQHMFWLRRPDIIEAWYLRFDDLIGKILQHKAFQQGDPARLLIVSDHGFNRLDYKVHLNQWLIEKGYLVPKTNLARDFKSIDWSATQAYAIGLNSLYVNKAGREGQGIVSPQDYPSLLHQLQLDLLDWKTAAGQPVIHQAPQNEQIFEGAHSQRGPDLLIGYHPGFRASAETGLGSWEENSLVKNKDHWEADHCFDSSSVPGVLFTTNGLADFPAPSYRDFPILAIDAAPKKGGGAPPPKLEREDQEKVEERLKSLGYL